MKPLECRIWSGRIQSFTPPASSLPTITAMLLLGFSGAALSATNTVTSLADGGVGSVRQVMADSVAGDTLVFSVAGTIALPGGELMIAKDLTILGPGSSALAISGAGGRVFHISSNVTALISGVTICNGRTPPGMPGSATNNGGSSEPGGAILTAGSLKLCNCVVASSATGRGGDGFSPPIPPYPPHTPPSSGGSSGAGGAIYNSGALSISNCVITNNATGRGGARAHNDTYWSASGTAGAGGAIYSVGTLTMANSFVGGNATGGADGSGASGGGIWNGGNCFASDCVFNGNATAGGGDVGGGGGNGAGIYSGGLMALTNCTVSYNVCGGGGYGSASSCWPPGVGCAGGNGGAGGGIYTANAVMIGCTVAANQAGGGGGGGYTTISMYPGGDGGSGGEGGGIRCNGNFLVLTNCTIAGNFCGSGGVAGFSVSGFGGDGGAGGSGGGIYFGGNTQTVVTCTIVSNSTGSGAPGGGGPSSAGPVGTGGGVYWWAAAGALGGFLNNIVALNAGQSPDVAGGFSSLGLNLIGVTNGSSGFIGPGDLTGSSSSPIDPRVAPLADNGGATMTMALSPDSPAIDVGAAFGAPATDQRGIVRPQGRGVDIGAYEFQFTVPQITRARFQSASNFWLQSCGLPNHTYTVQTSTNLQNWSDVTNLSTDLNGLGEAVECNLTNCNARFYRLKSLAP
jgi:hypothetical protein